MVDVKAVNDHDNHNNKSLLLLLNGSGCPIVVHREGGLPMTNEYGRRISQIVNAHCQYLSKIYTNK